MGRRIDTTAARGPDRSTSASGRRRRARAGAILNGGRSTQVSDRNLLVLDAAYSLRLVNERQLEQPILARDLDGFFDHVWTVHPLVGASPEHCEADAFGAPRRTRLRKRHTVVEGPIARYRSLRRFPALNFLLAQLSLFRCLNRLVRRQGISVITAQDPFYLGLLALVLARSNSVPFTVTIVANYQAMSETSGPIFPRLLRWHFLERRLQRLVLSRADSVAVGSADNLRYALANGVSEDRTVDVGCGDLIEPIHFSDPASRLGVREELEVGDRPLVVFVARLVPVKHPFDVLDVLDHARRTIPDLAALFVGDGDLRPDLERRAQELGLQEDVIFAGVRDQSWIARALANAAVVVSPVTGRALIEAALSATPIVAYDTEWQPEFITDGLTGVIVPHRDTAAMAAAVSRLVLDRPAATTLGANARAMALRVMDPGRSIESRQRHYEQVLARHWRRGSGREPDPALPR